MAWKIGSLFSGMLGLDLAVELVTGAHLDWACEIEPLPRRLIRARRPAARLFEDVRRLRPPPCDLLTGGFPCQDISVAGLQAGLAGEKSGLWGEMRRVIELARPRRVLIENVRNLRTLGLAEVLADLQALGYAAEWQTVQALAAGALHKRSRIFIAAYPDVAGAPLLFDDGLREQYARAFAFNRNGFWSRFPCSPVIGAADLPTDVRGARLTATGNAVCPLQAAPLARALVGEGMPFGVQVEHTAAKLPFAGAIRGGRIYSREVAVPEALAMEWHEAWIDANPVAARAVLPADRNTYPTPSAADYGSSQNGSNGVGGENERPSAGTPSLSTMARNGALWPTPQAHDKKADRSEASKADGGGQTLTGAARNLWPSPTASMQTPEDIGQAMYAGSDPDRPAYRNAALGLWPTACTTDAASAARHTTDPDGAMHGGTTLTDAVRLWATTAAANWRSGSVGDECFERNSRPLQEQVLRLYPTPTASDHDGGRSSPDSRQGGPALRDLLDVSSAGGGRFLNPEWVAWLMGFPSGWFADTSEAERQIGLLDLLA